MPYPIRTMEETNTFAKLLQNAVNCCSATGIFSTASACLFSAPLRHGFCTTSEAHYCFYFALLHAKNSIGLQHLRCQIEEDILVTNNKKKKKNPLPMEISLTGEKDSLKMEMECNGWHSCLDTMFCPLFKIT